MKNIFVILLFVINILSADSKNIPTYMTNEEYSHYLTLINSKHKPKKYMTNKEMIDDGILLESWVYKYTFFGEDYVTFFGESYWETENQSNNILVYGYPADKVQPSKKVKINNLIKEEIIANILKDVPPYFQIDLAEAYKELLKAVYEIKNKNRVIDDVEFYNLVNEACVYDKTVQKIDDLAYFYSKQKNVDYELLIKLYAEIIRTYEYKSDSYLNLADVYLKTNNKELARQVYKRYLKLKRENKEDKIPKRVLKYLEN